MASLEDKPSILCPELAEVGIKVIPLWFKPQGGSKEGPVLLLSGVPIGYEKTIEACDFIKRPEGWLIDVSDKNETFWKNIFGEIKFTKKKPSTVYEPKAIIIAVPPNEIKLIINNFSDETLSHLTSSEGIFGADRIRCVQKDAIRGAINCKGVWSVIKSACLDRLSNNPEDVDIFEYLWSTARNNNLPVAGLPPEISHTALLSKVVERRRLSTKMESVIPQHYFIGKTKGFIVKVDWELRAILIGATNFGPIDSIRFNEVDLVARYLLDNYSEPVRDYAVIESIESRTQDILTADVEGGDWVDRLDIPELPLTDPSRSDMLQGSDVTPTKKSLSPPKVKVRNRLDITSAVAWSDVLLRLLDISNSIDGKVIKARVLCRHLFDSIVFSGDVNLARSNYLNALEDLLQIFNVIINDEDLQKLWSYNKDRINALVKSLAVNSKLENVLFKCLRDVNAASLHIESSILSNYGERKEWWWRGFSADRDLQGRWRLYRIFKLSAEPVDGVFYDSPEIINTVLYDRQRLARFMCLRVSSTQDRWHHVFQTVNGTLIQLSDAFASCDEASEVLASTVHDTYLRMPVSSTVWMSHDSPILLNEIHTFFDTFRVVFNTTELFTSLSNDLEWVETSKGIVAFLKGERIAQVSTGNLIHIFGECLYRYCNDQYFSQLDSVMSVLFHESKQSDLDLTIEEDILDALSEFSSELSSSLGVVGLQTLRDAISSPSPEMESACLIMLGQAIDKGEDNRLIAVMRDVILFATQYSPHTVTTGIFKEKIRMSVTNDYIFASAFTQFVALRLRWNGSDVSRYASTYLSGDLPCGEVYPSGSHIFKVGLSFLSLLQAISGESHVSVVGSEKLEQMSLI